MIVLTGGPGSSTVALSRAVCISRTILEVMATKRPPKRATSAPARDDVWVARQLVATLGGRFSRELGIDVDQGGREIERWCLAATLFGRRISSTVAMRTYAVLDQAGVRTVADAGQRSWEELVKLLDEGGYVRYDFSTATQLQKMAHVLSEHKGRVVAFMTSGDGEEDAARTLDRLPGWGPTTVRLFLRELGRTDELDPRAASAASHLKLRASRLTDLAARAGADPRDLEAAMVRLSLRHSRGMSSCPGGSRCTAIAPA